MLGLTRPMRVLALSIALIFISTGSALALGPGGWDHVGVGATSTTTALNGSVQTLAVEPVTGSLLAGGSFTSAGGNAGASHIAKWNGNSWSALGAAGSLNGVVRAIATYGGKVYAGGSFTNAGGDPDADFLAVWNGSSWSSPCSSATAGPPITANVNALQIINSTLFVGGSFQNGGGIASADFLLACDLNTKTSSSTVAGDGDINSGIYALTADSNGTLYAGGSFINLGGNDAADHVAAYNGAWHAMGTGSVDDIVRSLTAAGTNVYIGTDAVNIAGIAQADHVARWNGSSWSAMGSNTGGTDGYFSGSSAFPYAMTTSGSNVYVTGSFQNANGDPLADEIVRFDGVTWHPVGSNGAGNGPLNSQGLAVAIYGGQLYAGGSFTSAGGDNLAQAIACFARCTFPPSVSSINPRAGSTAGGATVTVYGTHFAPGDTVRFGSTASSAVTFLFPTRLTADAPAHADGTVHVSVTAPTGTSASTNGDLFAFGAPGITSLAANAGPIAGGNTVAITGRSFLPGSTVKFGTTLSPTVNFVSGTKLTAVAPAHASGVVPVRVTTPAGTNQLVNGDLYAYGAPTVGSFSPLSGRTATLVNVFGTNFVPGAQVRFAGKASPAVTFSSVGHLVAVVPNGAVAGVVSVTTAAGTATSASAFTPTLSVTSFTPASGPAGTVVTIHGVGFNSGSAVKFNGTSASTVVFVSSTQIKATVPSAAITGPITVTNSSGVVGTVRSATAFTKT